MRKKLLSSLFLTLFGLGILGQASAQQKLIVQVKPSGSDFWGYANEKGEIVIPAQYAKCFGFTRDGFAIAVNPQTKLYGFINLKGEALATEVVDFRLQSFFGFDVEGFSDGLVAIAVGKKWGYLNTSGKFAVPAKYDDVTSFNGGFAVVRSVDTYTILNTKGEEIAITEPGVVSVKGFSEGLAPYKTVAKLTGFLGTDGKVAIQAQFESVGYFKNGLAWAKSNGAQVGYINTKGEWVIKPQFTAGKDFDAESGLARVKVGEKWCYVNKSGEILNVNDTESWGDFSNGLAEGKRLKKHGFYDNKGKWVIEPQYDDVRDFKNGYASVKVGDKWGVINKEGKFLLEPTYTSIKDFELTK